MKIDAGPQRKPWQGRVFQHPGRAIKDPFPLAKGLTGLTAGKLEAFTSDRCNRRPLRRETCRVFESQIFSWWDCGPIIRIHGISWLSCNGVGCRVELHGVAGWNFEALNAEDVKNLQDTSHYVAGSSMPDAIMFFFHICSFKQTSKSNIEIPWNPSHVAREILVLRVFVVATCPIALHHIDALGTARQDWSQEKNLQKLKDTTSRAETRQNWKCTLLVLNDFYQMLAFKISQFSIRNLAIGYYLQ